MVIFGALLGLFIGSFLNVLIDRLPKNQNVLWGRSHCDYCRRTLRWYELIPVLSFVFQGGKCVRCHRRLSWQYPAIELVTATGFCFVFSYFAAGPLLVGASCVIFSSFLVLFMADAKEQILPDSMVVLGILGSLVYLWHTASPVSIGIHILAGVVSFSFFYFLWFITKRRGMGFGDVKLAFLLGLLMGYPETVMALYVAFLTGAAVGVILVLGGKKKLKSKIAFGPFLIFGIVCTVVFHSTLLHLWNSIL